MASKESKSTENISKHNVDNVPKEHVEQKNRVKASQATNGKSAVQKRTDVGMIEQTRLNKLLKCARPVSVDHRQSRHVPAHMKAPFQTKVAGNRSRQKPLPSDRPSSGTKNVVISSGPKSQLQAECTVTGEKNTTDVIAEQKRSVSCVQNSDDRVAQSAQLTDAHMTQMKASAVIVPDSNMNERFSLQRDG